MSLTEARYWWAIALEIDAEQKREQKKAERKAAAGKGKR